MLKQRVITALILAPLFLALVFLADDRIFALVIGAIVTLAGWEWARLSGLKRAWQRILYALTLVPAIWLVAHREVTTVLSASLIWWGIAALLVVTYPFSARSWSNPVLRLAVGYLVLAPTWLAVTRMREGDWTGLGVPADGSPWMLLYSLAIVFCADIGAYFAGKTFGKHKLAPRVSPGKSIEGVVGGVLAVALFAWSVGSMVLHMTSAQLGSWVGVSMLCGLLSVLGDLMESLAKREAGVKDSSSLLPGHGGILDRIDSITLAAPLFLFIALQLGWVAV
ncbi:phosphatidate cytidylyltransferase [Hahella sp. SMD15-11]|uniref:Phosphatidate cytidylyltransferase n=1 Tax=Thermohahella caldifontis TaxID=3142973 RepID=A0AB39V094_9GAMM